MANVLDLWRYRKDPTTSNDHDIFLRLEPSPMYKAALAAAWLPPVPIFDSKPNTTKLPEHFFQLTSKFCGIYIYGGCLHHLTPRFFIISYHNPESLQDISIYIYIYQDISRYIYIYQDILIYFTFHKYRYIPHVSGSVISGSNFLIAWLCFTGDEGQC